MLGSENISTVSFLIEPKAEISKVMFYELSDNYKMAIKVWMKLKIHQNRDTILIVRECCKPMKSGNVEALRTAGYFLQLPERATCFIDVKCHLRLTKATISEKKFLFNKLDYLSVITM